MRAFSVDGGSSWSTAREIAPHGVSPQAIVMQPSNIIALVYGTCVCRRLDLFTAVACHFYSVSFSLFAFLLYPPRMTIQPNRLTMSLATLH